MTDGQTPIQTIYTIGHSTHSIDDFVSLLTLHKIDAVADVRSTPFSGRQPQFNRDSLQIALAKSGIKYVFLGNELGGRSMNRDCIVDGRVSFALLSRTPTFRLGVERLKNGSKHMRIAMMCAERNPVNCHRAILVGRAIVDYGTEVFHILADGRTQSHSSAMKSLAERLGLMQQTLFGAIEDVTAETYKQQEMRIAYQFTVRDKTSPVGRR